MTFELKCDELRELVENGGQLIDVRSNLEYSRGALKNAVNIPLETIPNNTDTIDKSKPVSPAWLSAEITLPFTYGTADELLGAIDFSAGIDQEAVGAISEAFAMGELGDDISDVGEFQVDALDDWAARLRDGLADFRFALEDIAARDGIVLSWYDRV